LLFSSQYIVGDALQMLLRDQGFWAFFLTSLVFFVRFYRSLSWTDAIAWQLAMIVAMLFRVEGITYLLALPFVLMFNKNLPWRTRGYALMKSHSVNLSAGLVITGYLFIKGLSVSHLGRLKEIFTPQLLEDLTRKFMQRSEIMANEVLGNFLDQFATEGLLITFLLIMLAKTISSAGWITVGLAAYAGRLRQRLIDHDTWKILAAVMIIALTDMFLIILKVFVLSGRYVAPLTLILIVVAAFGLKQLIDQLQSGKTSKRFNWLVMGMLLILILGMVKNMLPKREGYNYQQEAAAWLTKNTTKSDTVFFDNQRLQYHFNQKYAGDGRYTWDIVKEYVDDRRILKYRYIAISYEKGDEEKLALLKEVLADYEFVAKFDSVKSKKSVLIFKKIEH
jgi:hypothetical protein